jgi:hypothetical protein
MFVKKTSIKDAPMDSINWVTWVEELASTLEDLTLALDEVADINAQHFWSHNKLADYIH